MLDSKAITLSQQVAVRPLGPGRFTSVLCPTRLGSLTSTAFGGSCLAIAASAAYQQIGENFHLYSISGHFIRPAMTDRKLFCQVENIRNSRSFRTREVRVTQEADDGLSRLCLIALADFHVEEPRSMAVYSTSPEAMSLPGSHPGRSTPTPAQAASSTRDLYREIEKFIEIEPLTPSGRGTTEFGQETSSSPSRKLDKPSPLAIHAERFRARGPLENEAEQVSGLVFYMDKGLAYIPALHCGYQPSDASACATLDFALRMFDHEVDIQDWHVTQQRSIVAYNARVYSEGRVWDSRGRLLACMTQQTILRPNLGISPRI